MPLRSRDPRLHDVLRPYAEVTLASLPQAESITAKVRRFVLEQLASGNLSLDHAGCA